MSEKYSQYGKKAHYSSSGWVSGIKSYDIEYQRDNRRPTWIAIVVFGILFTLAVTGIDIADLIVRGIDFVAALFAQLVWGIF